MRPEELSHRGDEKALGLRHVEAVQTGPDLGLDDVRPTIRTDGRDADIEKVRAGQKGADLALGLHGPPGDVEQTHPGPGGDFKDIQHFGLGRAAPDRSPVEGELPRSEAKL